MRKKFLPPPYPYEQLDEFRVLAEALPGGAVDLSIGTPCDPVPEVIRKLFLPKLVLIRHALTLPQSEVTIF